VPATWPSAQLSASSIVATSTTAAIVSKVRVTASRACPACRHRDQPASHIPAVSKAAPASSTSSPRKNPANTIAVPSGTLTAAPADALPGSAPATRNATSAAANPAKWKCATVNERTTSSKPNNSYPARSATSALAAITGVPSAVTSAISRTPTNPRRTTAVSPAVPSSSVPAR
jgi:hypothetical protein